MKICWLHAWIKDFTNQVFLLFCSCCHAYTFADTPGCHTPPTSSHILSRGPPTACQHCGLTIEHILLACTVLQQSRDEYYTVDSLMTLFETIPEACIIEFLREAGFYYLIWIAIYPIQLFIQIRHQLMTLSSWINPHYWTPPLEFVYRA